MAFQIKTIFSVLYKTIFDILIYTLIVSIILALLPNHIFTNFGLEPIGYELHNISDTVSNWNTILDDKTEFINEDLIAGPESIAENNGFIYTGLADGRLIEIDKNTHHIRVITKFNVKNDCYDNEYWKLVECGRPLGLRFNKDGYLYVLEAFQGLFKVNITTGDKQLINFEIEDNMKGIYNDLVFDDSLNVVYISVSSTRWALDRVPWSILEYDRSGHVFALNLQTGKTIKLLANLRFANGIELTKKALLVSETATFKIHSIPIEIVHKAIKSNRPILSDEITVLAEALIGEPDNIRLAPDGDLWVGLFVARTDGKTLRDYLANFPFVRKAIGRLIYVVSIILDYINTNLCHNHALEKITFDLYSGHIFYGFNPKHTAILRLDSNTGQIKQVLGSNKFNSISEAFVSSNGDLYYGSFRNRFLGKIKKGMY